MELDYPDFEIIILPDADIGSIDNLHATRYTLHAKEGAVPIRIIPTGPLAPSRKRDIAINYANGEILAFIDDDAYPVRVWLKNAVNDFNDPKVAAVGGPAVTPQGDTTKQKASGLIYSSPLVSGKYAYRYLPGKRMEVDDYPSCNLLIRKSIMQELGGFKTNFWPGEDTKLCLDVTKRLGKKIIYDPEVIVYHHRRNLFLPHLRQIANYALHRGYFVKRYPATSLKVAYFIPSIFLLFLLAGWCLVWPISTLKIIYLFILSLYLLLAIIFSSNKKPSLFLLIYTGTILTHLTYGLFFLIGLLAKTLSEEKGTVPVESKAK